MTIDLKNYIGDEVDPTADSTTMSKYFLGVPKESRIGGVIDIAEQDLATMTSPLSTLGVAVENHMFGDKYINAKEAKEKFPNVDYPKGGSLRVIKNASEEKSAHDLRNSLINNMPEGILSSVAKFVPTAIGLGLQGAAITALAPEAAGVAAAEAGTLWGKIAAGAVSGAVDFSSQLLPFQFAQQQQQEKIQESVGPGEQIGELASNAILGAAMGAGGSFIKAKYGDSFKEDLERAQKKEFKNEVPTTLGSKRVMTPEAHNEMVKTGAQQMQEGKNVNIDPIIKQGMYAERVGDPIPSDEEIESLSKDNLNTSKTKLESLNKELTKLSDDHIDLVKKIKSSLKKTSLSIAEMRPIIRNENTRFILDHRYGDKLANDIETRNVANPIDKKRIDIINKKSLIKDKEMLEQDLEKRKKKLATYIEKDEVKPDRKKHIDREKQKIDEIQDHIDNIKDGKRLHPHAKDLEKINSIKDKISKVRNDIDYHEKIVDSKGTLGLLRDTSPPLTKDELENAMEKQASYRSDEGITDYAHRLLDDEPELKEADDVGTIEDVDYDALSKDEKKIIDDIKEDFERSDKLVKALNKFKGCING